MLGKLTRDYRKRLALSQEELAERTGLSSRAIRAIETGRSGTPRPITVRLLADALELSEPERAGYSASASGAETPGASGAETPSTSGAGAPAGGGTQVPQQLPLAVPVFAGRCDYLRRLTALLDDGRPGVIVLSGTAGVGKTSLAVHWAHQVADRFPDGQLFVNLHGFGPSQAAVDAGEAIRGFLQAMEVPAQRIPADRAGQIACYRSELAGRRMLVVADNARDADHVRPLVPGNPDCLLLTTSRRQLTSLVVTEGAVPLPLELPSPDEARTLLVGRLGAGRVAAETDAADALVDRCARLPLALSVVAARAALRPDFPLASIVDELDSAGSQLDRMHGGDAVSDVRTVFSWSYRRLSAGASLFRLLGLHPGPDIDRTAAAGLAGCSVDDLADALAELADASLTTETAPGRYVLHDLMRGYAGELATRVDNAAHRHAARRRMLDFYLHTCHAAAALLEPHNKALGPGPPPGIARVALRDQHDALRWFAAEITTLLAVTRLAVESGFDTHAWQLAVGMHAYLHRQGRWHEAAETHRGALRAAERLGSLVAQAHVHQLLGRALTPICILDARHHLESAYQLFRALGDTAAAARTQQSIGLTYEQEDPARSLPHARLALRLATSGGDAYLRGRILNGLGWLHSLLGQHAAARTHCEQALHLMLETGDDDGAADAWDSLGVALHHLGDLAGAARSYQRALDLYRALGHRYYLALTLTHLGETHQAAGDLERAHRVWRDAREIFAQLRGPQNDQARRRVAQLLAGSPAERRP